MASNSEKVWRRYRKIKKLAKRTCRQTHTQYVNDIFENIDSNPKPRKTLWTYIKSLRQDSVGIGDLKDKNNIPISDPTVKATLIHEQFDYVFSNPDPPISPSFYPADRLPDMPPISISWNSILKLLSKINPNKANGPDKVPGKFLKLCANELVDIYQILFQASLDQGIVPQDWKEADIVPLFKKGDRSMAENYRPISLTSLSCKLLEHVVHVVQHSGRRTTWFHKKRSCISQLINTLDDFANTLNNKEQTTIGFFKSS